MHDRETDGVPACALDLTGYDWALMPAEGETLRDAGSRARH